MAAPTRQRTFDLVPETLVPQNAPKKAMTLKQAKKAASAATKGPRMSRAERARLEKEELDRQRKERDRQRASEKARLAREKKAAKLAEEKASRKKMGIPEPSRFVRSSQPTISGFVTAGNKRRRTGTESIGHTSSYDSEGLEPMKREEITAPSESRIHQHPEENDNDLLLQAEQAEEEQVSALATKQDCQPSKANFSFTSGSPPRSLPMQGDPEVVVAKDDTASSIKSKTKNNLLANCKKAIEGCDEFGEDAELYAAMVESAAIAEGLFENERGRSAMIARKPSPHLEQNANGSKDIPKHDDWLGPKNLRSSTKTNAVKPTMLPPPAPIKRIAQTKEPTSIAKHDATAKISTPKPYERRDYASHSSTKKASCHGLKSVKTTSVPNLSTNSARQPLGDRSMNMPWTPTQAYLKDNFEDIFPSPSQEIRELGVEEKVIYPVSRRGQTHRQQDFRTSSFKKPQSYNRQTKVSATEESALEYLHDLFPSSSQALKELEGEDEVPQRTSPLSSRNPHTYKGDHKVSKLGTPNLNKLTVPETPPSAGSTTATKRKNLFFKEKEEDVAHTALAASFHPPSSQPRN